MRKQLSVTECAERRGVSRSSVVYAIHRGDLAAVKIGNAWVINEDACDAYRPLTKSEAGKRGGAAMRGRPRKRKPKAEEE